MTHPNFTNYGYQINLELGHNRAGGRITYKATEINTQNTVVVKQFQFARTGSSWSDYDAYQREIDILKGLDHPNIPRYLDSFQTPAGFCMIQEYKNAPSLATEKHWKPHQVKHIAIEVLEILKYLQNRIPLVIHRDLKPENILVDDRLNVSLVDFGFARMGGGEVAVSSVVKGTLGFMPPEQMFNRQLTPASDLYSLGATLICLLTQIKSTEVGNLIDDSGKINFKAKVSHLSDEFIKWLEKMVEPLSKNRYQNAAEAIDALIPLEVLRPRTQTRKSLWIKLGIAAASVGIFIPVTLNYLEDVKVKKAAEMAALQPEFEIIPPYSGSVDFQLTVDEENNQIPASMKTKNLEISLKINNLALPNYASVCQLFDPQGRLVAAGQSILKTTDGQLTAKCGYQFNQNQHQVGTWQFEFFLDGQKVAQKSLTVLPY